jgi:putative endonuclease
MCCYIYILKSLKGRKYYFGSTSNVGARLECHNKGLQRSTKNRTPFILIYSEDPPSKTEVQKREKQIQNYKGYDAFKWLMSSDSGPTKRSFLQPIT